MSVTIRSGELRVKAAEAVAQTLRLKPDDVCGIDSLLDLDGFDSVAVVAVLERLEDDYGIEVPAERIVPEAFESLDSLTDLLAAACAVQGGQE